MKPATSKRRLMALVTLLRKLPRKRFNYATWVGHNWGGKADLSCGTVACALGWATTIPSLRRAGLRLEAYSTDEEGRFDGTPVCGNHSDEDAAAIVFGITSDEAKRLFFPAIPWFDSESSGLPDEATPKQVAKIIERFVKAKFGSVR